MTLDDIENSLTNGFHDAFLQSVNIDYVNREATLILDVWIGDLDAENERLRERYRKGRLKLYQLVYFVVEAPDSNYSYNKPGALWIDSGSLESLKKPPSTQLTKTIPEGTFEHWVFVRNWNSFIYMAAMDAQFDWIEE